MFGQINKLKRKKYNVSLTNIQSICNTLVWVVALQHVHKEGPGLFNDESILISVVTAKTKHMRTYIFMFHILSVLSF